MDKENTLFFFFLFSADFNKLGQLIRCTDRFVVYY